MTLFIATVGQRASDAVYGHYLWIVEIRLRRFSVNFVRQPIIVSIDVYWLR